MVWPPPIPPNTRTNSTAQQDEHASDHNAAAEALDELVLQTTRIGSAVAAGTSSHTMNGSALVPITILQRPTPDYGTEERPANTWTISPDGGLVLPWDGVYLGALRTTLSGSTTYSRVSMRTIQRSESGGPTGSALDNYSAMVWYQSAIDGLAGGSNIKSAPITPFYAPAGDELELWYEPISGTNTGDWSACTVQLVYLGPSNPPLAP